MGGPKKDKGSEIIDIQPKKEEVMSSKTRKSLSEEIDLAQDVLDLQKEVRELKRNQATQKENKKTVLWIGAYTVINLGLLAVGGYFASKASSPTIVAIEADELGAQKLVDALTGKAA